MTGCIIVLLTMLITLMCFYIWSIIDNIKLKHKVQKLKQENLELQDRITFTRPTIKEKKFNTICLNAHIEIDDLDLYRKCPEVYKTMLANKLGDQLKDYIHTYETKVFSIKYPVDIITLSTKIAVLISDDNFENYIRKV